jgi:hypothetical protein
METTNTIGMRRRKPRTYVPSKRLKAWRTTGESLKAFARQCYDRGDHRASGAGNDKYPLGYVARGWLMSKGIRPGRS